MQVETAPMNNADLLDALRDCYEPTLKRNLVELNMVRAVHVALDGDAPGSSIPGVPAKYSAEIELIAGSSDENTNAQLVALVENRLKGLPTISQVHIRLLPPVFPILNQPAR